MMVIPCLCLSRFSSCTATTKKVPRPKGLAASFLIDIPTHWEPRTNKHPTGVFVAPPAAWPCCSSPVPPTKTLQLLRVSEALLLGRAEPQTLLHNIDHDRSTTDL